MNEQKQTTHQDPLINLLFDGGLQNALPRIVEILINAAMLLERDKSKVAAGCIVAADKQTPPLMAMAALWKEASAQAMRLDRTGISVAIFESR